MKTNAIILFAATLIFFTACNKNDSNPDSNTSGTYINTNAGSTWTYHEDNSSGVTPTNSDYTVTSTSQDSTIKERKYHVYNYSYGGSQYLSASGHDYYQYDSIPITGGVNVERLYLKDNAAQGDTWSQNFDLTISGIPIILKATNKITEKGISRTVNGQNYSNVTHVSTTLSSALITSGFTSSIDSYYAPNYGMIENTTVIHLDVPLLGLAENVDVTTKLVSADLK
jgi:hypothetical protein